MIVENGKKIFKISVTKALRGNKLKRMIESKY